MFIFQKKHAYKIDILLICCINIINNMTNIPPCIAVVQRWNSNYHGVSSNEYSYIDYMEKKYLLSWDTHYYDSDTDTDDSYDYTSMEQLDDALSFADPETVVEGNREAWSSHITCIIRKEYIYRGRTFCIRNYGIEKLQRKWRDYYQKRLAFMKNPRNLRYRQIYGKYPN